MATHYVNPRYRAYGKARIDIAKRLHNPEDWERLWRPPLNKFPFKWGECWKHCVEYQVDDFAAEVGFLVDILGLPVIAFDTGYAMFTSPSEEFTFGVVPTPENQLSTLPETIRLQFMVDDIFNTTEELQSRGIEFEQMPEPVSEDSRLFISSFQTPHGISIELWAVVESEANNLEQGSAEIAKPFLGDNYAFIEDKKDSDVENTCHYQQKTGSPVEIENTKDEEQSEDQSGVNQSDVEYEDILEDGYFFEDNSSDKEI